MSVAGEELASLVHGENGPVGLSSEDDVVRAVEQAPEALFASVEIGVCDSEVVDEMKRLVAAATGRFDETAQDDGCDEADGQRDPRRQCGYRPDETVARSHDEQWLLRAKLHAVNDSRWGDRKHPGVACDQRIAGFAVSEIESELDVLALGRPGVADDLGDKQLRIGDPGAPPCRRGGKPGRG